MDEPKKRKPFNGKGLTSFVVFLSFVVMTVTGIVLYVTPMGRIAHWTHWTVLGLDKEEWAAAHITSSLLFMVASIIHLYYNWTIFWCYFKMRFEKGFNLKREFAAAVVLCAVFTAGGIWEFWPIGYVVSWNEDIKDYWERVSTHPPVPHAEEWTIIELAERTDTSIDVIIARFEAEGYDVESANETLLSIASRHGVSPNALFALLDATRGGGGRGGGRAERYRSGAGLGRKTLAEYCQECGVSVDDVLEKLEDAGVDAEANHRIKAIADSAGITPGELAALIER